MRITTTSTLETRRFVGERANTPVQQCVMVNRAGVATL